MANRDQFNHKLEEYVRRNFLETSHAHLRGQVMVSDADGDETRQTEERDKAPSSGK